MTIKKSVLELLSWFKPGRDKEKVAATEELLEAAAKKVYELETSKQDLRVISLARLLGTWSKNSAITTDEIKGITEEIRKL